MSPMGHVVPMKEDHRGGPEKLFWRCPGDKIFDSWGPWGAIGAQNRWTFSAQRCLGLLSPLSVWAHNVVNGHDPCDQCNHTVVCVVKKKYLGRFLGPFQCWKKLTPQEVEIDPPDMYLIGFLSSRAFQRYMGLYIFDDLAKLETKRRDFYPSNSENRAVWIWSK